MTESLPKTPTVPTPKKPNKRLSRRWAVKTTARVRIYRSAMGLGPNIASALLDLSETGLRVVLKETATVGQEVAVNLESAASGRTAKLPSNVVWVVPATDGTFVVGLHFQKALSYSDLQALTKP